MYQPLVLLVFIFLSNVFSPYNGYNDVLTSPKLRLGLTLQ